MTLDWHDVITAMRNGEVLRLEFNGSGSRYWLSPSRRAVLTHVARQAMCNPHIISGRDGLWPGVSQTWRYRGDQKCQKTENSKSLT
jgi:hypothetical protein